MSNKQKVNVILEGTTFANVVPFPSVNFDPISWGWVHTDGFPFVDIDGNPNPRAEYQHPSELVPDLIQIEPNRYRFQERNGYYVDLPIISQYDATLLFSVYLPHQTFEYLTSQE